jgi:hypothetical protein
MRQRRQQREEINAEQYLVKSNVKDEEAGSGDSTFKEKEEDEKQDVNYTRQRPEKMLLGNATGLKSAHEVRCQLLFLGTLSTNRSI